MRTQNPKPSLLIADHSPTRRGLRIVLDDAVSACAEAENAEQAIDVARREQPDVCLIGLEMPGGGLAATRGICGVAPDTAVIVLATIHNFDDLVSCVHAGAAGYVSSDIDPDSLRRVVHAVDAGEGALPRSMQRALMRELLGFRSSETTGLTTREAQVLSMLRRGRNTEAIAEHLGISPITVRRHISSAMQKTGAENRQALASLAPGPARSARAETVASAD